MRGIATVFGVCVLVGACGSNYDSAPHSTPSPSVAPLAGDTTFRVHDSWAGQWTSTPAPDNCVWHVYLKDEGQPLVTLDSGNTGPGQTSIATIPAPDGHQLLFQTSGCGTWTHVG